MTIVEPVLARIIRDYTATLATTVKTGFGNFSLYEFNTFYNRIISKFVASLRTID